MLHEIPITFSASGFDTGADVDRSVQLLRRKISPK